MIVSVDATINSKKLSSIDSDRSDERPFAIATKDLPESSTAANQVCCGFDFWFHNVYNFFFMPIAALKCPHCETPVEIQVTAVTRSRPCPTCEKTIMLQVAGRESRTKRKALLVGKTSLADSIDKPEISFEPKQLPGNAFERMCADPEIQGMRRLFFGSIGAVTALIVIASVLQWMGVWTAASMNAPVVVDRKEEARLIEEAVPPKLNLEVPNKGIKKVAVASQIKKLSFTSTQKSGESLALTSEPRLVLEKFLAANSVEERMKLMANASVLEEPVRHYYEKHPVGAIPYEEIQYGLKSQENFTEFRVVLKDGTKRFAAVVSTPEGPMVDWPSFVALGDLDWEQMRQSRPTTPVLMRVLAAPAVHFTGHFSDADALRCVQLVPAGNPSATPIYGYLPRGNDLDRQIDYQLRSSGGELAALTVKICYSHEASGNDQAWITELVVSGWVTALNSNSVSR
jgi:hypothetical protein